MAQISFNTERHARCSYLRPALQTAPLWSEKDIFEVQFEVSIHPGHSDRPESGWESPKLGCSRAPGTKPEPAEEQCIYSVERAVTAQAPMALFGKACTLSPPPSACIQSGVAAVAVIRVFPVWLSDTYKHTQAQWLQLSSALQYVHIAPAVQLGYCSSESMSDLMGNEREGHEDTVSYMPFPF